MSSLVERLRTWLWWLEPRFEKRRALHYGYERNWHRSRKWRRRRILNIEEFGAPTSFAEMKITPAPKSHPIDDRPTRYPDFGEEKP